MLSAPWSGRVYVTIFHSFITCTAQAAGNVSGQALATAAAWGGRTRTLGACAPGAAAETPAPAALQALLAREPRSDGALVRSTTQTMPRSC